MHALWLSLSSRQRFMINLVGTVKSLLSFHLRAPHEKARLAPPRAPRPPELSSVHPRRPVISGPTPTGAISGPLSQTPPSPPKLKNLLELTPSAARQGGPDARTSSPGNGPGG